MSVLTHTVLSIIEVPAAGKTAAQLREQAVRDGILERTQVPELDIDSSAQGPSDQSNLSSSNS